MQSAARSLRAEGRTLALVPTMGCLHEGHLSLIRAGRGEADVVITSVFVNPIQFGPADDYERYPRNLERDCELASDAGSDYLFAPGVEEMYPPGEELSVDPGPLATKLEGASRPGHFAGVATVVARLFRITMPHVAVFGQKDAQQILVVREMVRREGLDVRIRPMPIVREPDGLAMSSRNTFLTPDQRREAAVLYKSLQHAAERIGSGCADPALIKYEMTEMIGETSGVIDYLSFADTSTLDERASLAGGGSVLVSLAVRFGTTRLIDNILLAST